MSELPTLILHSRYDEDSQRMWQAAVDAGWKTARFGWPHGDAIPGSIAWPLAFYGGYMVGEKIARSFGVELLSPSDSWLISLPRHLTKRDIALVEFGEVRTWSAELFPVFLKTASGAKSMASRVYFSRDDLPRGIADDEILIAQQPVSWAAEYRCWMIDGEIVTASLYARNGGTLASDHDMAVTNVGHAVNYLSRVRSELPSLPRACVVDVGIVSARRGAPRGWAVIEANPAWCSGLYGCSATQALAAVRLSCRPITGAES